MYQNIVPFYGRIMFHCMYNHIWFIDSSIDCFHLLATVKNVAVNIGKQESESLFAILSGIYLEVELLDHRVTLCLAF